MFLRGRKPLPSKCHRNQGYHYPYTVFRRRFSMTSPVRGILIASVSFLSKEHVGRWPRCWQDVPYRLCQTTRNRKSHWHQFESLVTAFIFPLLSKRNNQNLIRAL